MTGVRCCSMFRRPSCRRLRSTVYRCVLRSVDYWTVKPQQVLLTEIEDSENVAVGFSFVVLLLSVDFVELVAWYVLV